MEGGISTEGGEDQEGWASQDCLPFQGLDLQIFRDEETLVQGHLQKGGRKGPCICCSVGQLSSTIS